MAVTITSGTQLHNEGVFQIADALTESTATAEQSISVNHRVTTLSGGTATGFTINRYVVPAGAEGMEKLIVHLATGESYVRFGAATTNLLATGLHYLGIDTAGVATATGIAGAFIGQATGAFVLGDSQDYLRTIFLNGAWHLLGGAATLATST